MDNKLLRLQDLVDNPTPRVPICLCLDTSGSMLRVVRGETHATGQEIVRDGETWQVVTGGITALDDLNQAIRQFYQELNADENAKYAAEICIVTFGGDKPQLIIDFANLERQGEVSILQADGETPMGEAVNLALDCLEQRKKEYRAKGVDYFQPWLVLMTDGANNGAPAEFERAVSRTTELVNSQKLTLFPLAIASEDEQSEQAALDTLKRFSPKRTPLKVGSAKFSQFFQWLSQSVARTSASIPSEKVQLDLEGIKGWAEL